jgi:hypothetical protein
MRSDSSAYALAHPVTMAASLRMSGLPVMDHVDHYHRKKHMRFCARITCPNKNLTVKHIYYPLAKSNGKIYELLKALKAKDGDRQKKLFQFLNDIGARALRMQLGRVLEMSESSADRWTYEAKIRERFGGQQELNFLPIPISSSSASSPPSE